VFGVGYGFMLVVWFAVPNTHQEQRVHVEHTVHGMVLIP
jgi:hypothetical protein